MSTRGSPRGVVNTKFGDRSIIDLPVLGEGVFTQYVPHFTVDDMMLKNRSENMYTSNSVTIPSYYSEPVRPFPHKEMIKSQQLDMRPSNVVPAAYVYPNNIHNVFVPRPSSFHHGPAYLSSPEEIHHYYGPNGEKLPGPPKKTYLKNRKLYPTDFSLEAILEYGKMVSVKIKRGHISFREIPGFLMSDLKRTYRMVPRVNIFIEAEGDDYSIYPQILKEEEEYTDNRSYSFEMDDVSEQDIESTR
ncbi:unnamed protein product [Mytilus coruscus]|uniref:Uncharacterized protein n=1 Tax=Mytilus coruscus TaxID=42192 RepID=A0A6J8CGD4_MYTCO|nr:unnamed protein product [Mytilus coruscus]